MKVEKAGCILINTNDQKIGLVHRKNKMIILFQKAIEKKEKH